MSLSFATTRSKILTILMSLGTATKVWVSNLFKQRLREESSLLGCYAVFASRYGVTPQKTCLHEHCIDNATSHHRPVFA